MNVEPLKSARSMVIDVLLQHRTLSRSDLAEISGLSRSAITEVTQGLLKEGLLQELPVTRDGPQRGRPATLLTFRAVSGYFLGASITGSSSSMVLTDLRGDVVSDCMIPFSHEPAGTAASIRKGMLGVLRASGIPRNKVLGAGIAVSGIIDQHSGICQHSAALNWRDVPIGRLVERAIGIPTYMDNDANAIAMGQKLSGRARDFKHYSSVILGRTIGCAHSINGKLYRGCNGGAGEIGHITLDPAGPLCLCGKHGCLDMFAGGAAMQIAAREAGIEIGSMRELEALAASGSSTAIALLRKGGQALGLAIASLVQINNPEVVLFADVEGFGNGLFRTMTRQTIENNILPRFLSSTQIIFHSIEETFLARGAASIATQEYLLASS